jgi:hypothetical protein
MPKLFRRRWIWIHLKVRRSSSHAACREAMISEQRELKFFGVFYKGLSTVIAAIDALATLLVYPERHWSEGSALRPQPPPE